MDNTIWKNTDAMKVDELYECLAQGINSMKSSEVYTIEEAWQEIDRI